MGEFLVLNKDDDRLSVLDGETFEEVERFDAGIHPDGIAYRE